MIIGIEGARFLTDEQWLVLMKLVGNSPMELEMPSKANASATLLYEGTKYIIHADGSYNYD